MSFELVDSEWDRILDNAAAALTSELRIVCPFIKARTTHRLLRTGRPDLLQVITRFNLADFCDGISDPAALRTLMEAGAKLRGIKNLHAKLYVFDKNRAIVTSANLTEAALLRNLEFGFVSTDRTIVDCCLAYFDSLWPRAGSDLDAAVLKTWEDEIAKVRTTGARPSIRARLPDRGVVVGLVTAPVLIPPLVADAPQYFVKFFGSTGTRASRSETILSIVESSGCHFACTYPQGKRPRQVEDGAVMFVGRLVKKPGDILVFGRAVAVHHEAGGDDASPADLVRRPWKRKWPHYVRVHHGEFLAGTLAGAVSLNQLMTDLGGNAFTTTARNQARGKGNTNPRRSIQRQPAVQLSDQGRSWLNDRLETAFQARGKLATADLELLDWPSLPRGPAFVRHEHSAP